MTNLERRMQNKQLQGVCTKNGQWYSQTEGNDVEQRCDFRCFESRKCPGYAQIYWKIVPSTWTSNGNRTY